MSKEKSWKATVHFDTVHFEVFNCDTKEEAEKSASEMAVDLAQSLQSIEPQMYVDFVEVEEV